MQSSAAPVPSPGSRSFAGVLMDLAAPEAKKPPARDFDGLEEDVATLSYERALHAHGRYRPAAPISKPQLIPEAAPPTAAIQNESLLKGRKSASITVRLCPVEIERLRQRAAESGLTISDYLRSCVFEVESLRTQVKETVAALRTLQLEKSQPAGPQWLRWFRLRRRSTAAA